MHDGRGETAASRLPPARAHGHPTPVPPVPYPSSSQTQPHPRIPPPTGGTQENAPHPDSTPHHTRCKTILLCVEGVRRRLQIGGHPIVASRRVHAQLVRGAVATMQRVWGVHLHVSHLERTTLTPPLSPFSRPPLTKRCPQPKVN